MLKQFENSKYCLKSLFKPDLTVTNLDSRIETHLNLCKIVKFGKFIKRFDLNEKDKIIQASFVNVNRSHPILKHEHLPIERHTVGTGEVWLVLKGRFEVEIFDLDQSSIGKYSVGKFDVVLISNGGHSLRALKKDSIIFECKNGPFLGSDQDKIYF